MEELAATESSWQTYITKYIEESAQQFPAAVKKEICEFSQGDINYETFREICKRARILMRQK